MKTQVNRLYVRLRPISAQHSDSAVSSLDFPLLQAMTSSTHRSRSRSPDSSNKRSRSSKDYERSHSKYDKYDKYDDRSHSRSRYRDGDDEHRPRLYRVDDRDRERRDPSQDRYRSSDRDRRRAYDGSRQRSDDRD